jgi:ribosome-associated protein
MRKRPSEPDLDAPVDAPLVDAPGALPATDDDPWSADERPSKTRMKQQSHDLQKLGRDLLALPASRLAAIDMPELLRDALEQMQRTRSHEGKRRQLQYIGKVMRGIDPEPLREAVAAFRVPGARETLALHEAERWRVRLVDEDGALTEWLAAHPETDAQALRTLIRNARKDAQAAAAAPNPAGTPERKGRAWREIFQLVRAGLSEAGRAGDDSDDDHDDGEDHDD